VKEQSPIIEKILYFRRPIQFLADVVVLCAAFFASYLPTINIQLGDFYFDRALSQLPFVVLIQFSTLFMLGAYTILWRYVSIEDLKVFIKAGVVSCVVLVILRFVLTASHFSLWQVPISVILIDTVLAFGGMLALRVLRRSIFEFREKKSF
jgi:FlaA1/EpsC-like NDP-sugar epimerase